MKRKTVTACLMSLCLAIAIPGTVCAADMDMSNLNSELLMQSAETEQNGQTDPQETESENNAAEKEEIKETTDKQETENKKETADKADTEEKTKTSDEKKSENDKDRQVADEEHVSSGDEAEKKEEEPDAECENPVNEENGQDMSVNIQTAEQGTDSTADAAELVAVSELDEEVPEEAHPLHMPVSKVLEQTKKYLQTAEQNPSYSFTQAAFGLARNGENQENAFVHTYYINVVRSLTKNKGKLTDGADAADYATMILAMTSMGKDARNIAGYNLFSSLSDYSALTEAGISSVAWALLAVNSHPAYEFPQVDNGCERTTRQKLVAYLLENESPQGGWTEDEQSSQPDPEVTGLVLQALAPNYQKTGYEKITDAIDRALTSLSVLQKTDGGYAVHGEETVEAAAQVLTGLCSLGIDPAKDQRFIKDGNWLVENLISYQITDNGFRHVKAGQVSAVTADQTATEKAYSALTAYDRLTGKKSSLYDMADYQLTAADPIEDKTDDPKKEDTKKDNTKQDPTSKEDEKNTGTGSDNTKQDGKKESAEEKKKEEKKKKKLTIKTGKKLKLASGSGKKLTLSTTSGKKLTVSNDGSTKKLTLSTDNSTDGKVTLSEVVSENTDNTENTGEETAEETEKKLTLSEAMADTAEDESVDEMADVQDTENSSEESVVSGEADAALVLDAGNTADTESAEVEKQQSKMLFISVFVVCMLIAAGGSIWYRKKKRMK